MVKMKFEVKMLWHVLMEGDLRYQFPTEKVLEPVN